MSYYAVKNGIELGIFETWAECEERVKGFKGAKYKKFETLEEAETYMAEETVSVSKDERRNRDYDQLITKILNDGDLVVFTDGGYNSKEEIAGYGVYILEPKGTKPIEISDIVRTDKFKDSNNITPEIMAVINAFDWAISNGYDRITIFHDYVGIGKWGKKEWKAKSDIAKWFITKLDTIYNEVLDIDYVWVPGHAGIPYNEEADRLATEAINKHSKPSFKMNETYFSCQNVGEKEVLDIIKKIELLSDIEIIDNEEKDKISYSIKYMNNKLRVIYYKKTSRTVVQGKPNPLFSLFISYYTERIPDIDLVQAYTKMYKSKIELTDVNSMVDELNLPKNFPEDAVKLIKQAISEKIAITLKSKYREEYDYGHLIFPACRALEATIKYLFEISGEHISDRALIGSNFKKNKNKLYELNNKRVINSPFKTKIENAYNTYYAYRNQLGHFGELLYNEEGGSNTMIVENSEEAIDIINEILETIKFD